MHQLNGESGGGQMLRTALALSMITGQAFRMTNIRGKRSRPGLMRQHLTCLNASAAISGATVDGADIVCAATSSAEPVLLARHVQAGMHVNAVGSSVPHARELDAAAVARSRLFVDRTESAQAEAGDFLLAKADGVVDDDHVLGEIGEVLTGRVAGRRTSDDITLFESVGLAVEDLAAVHYVARRARETGQGTVVEFGGERDVEY